MLSRAELHGVFLAQPADDGERGQLRLRRKPVLDQRAGRKRYLPRTHNRTYTPGIFYAFLIAGTGIPAILRFTEPRKFELVK